MGGGGVDVGVDALSLFFYQRWSLVGEWVCML